MGDVSDPAMRVSCHGSLFKHPQEPYGQPWEREGGRGKLRCAPD